MTGNVPKVSVLIPIYNVERYLNQCLDAVCHQTLRDIEIVCINDGSTDDSPRIIRKWAEVDKRIVVVDKDNSGYGASLNCGLKIATGEYVGIVEPDDFPERTMYKKMVRPTRFARVDVVKCNYFEHRNGTDFPVFNLDGHLYGRAFDPIDRPSVLCTIPAIWTGLYRRSFLEAEGIRFRETPGASFQDTGFTMKVWGAASRCVFVKDALLHYRVDNPGSSCKTTDKVFTVCDELHEAEIFLRARPDRCKHLLPWFFVDKWGKYRWNYERVSPSQHEIFARRMYDEYLDARNAGELDMLLFDEESRCALEALLSEGPERFVLSHTETF